MFGIGYLSGLVSWLRCLKSSHTRHFSAVDFGTRCRGDDQGDFNDLIIPACRSAGNSCFADLYFSSGSYQTLALVGALSPVSTTCITFMLGTRGSSFHGLVNFGKSWRRDCTSSGRLVWSFTVIPRICVVTRPP